MISARMLIGSGITALLTGAIGFASASYLQQQASAQRIAELEQQRAFDERADHQERAHALYGMWTTEPMITHVNRARAFLDRHPELGYEALTTQEDATSEEIAALDHVLRFWGRVEDYSAAEALDINMAARLLGPDAGGWLPYIETLRVGLSDDPQFGKVIYADRGARRLAILRRDQLARSRRLPGSGEARPPHVDPRLPD
ncbi:MAG: hypothetical protein H7124_01910 [Phycisphaerales bacterium]|nr:hypothetical protein [Hyphomonadaceae bacterium]